MGVGLSPLIFLLILCIALAILLVFFRRECIACKRAEAKFQSADVSVQQLKHELSQSHHDLVESQLQLSEFKTLVDSEVMILRTDPDGNVIQVSMAFAAFAGYEPNDLVGCSFRQILFPEALPEIYRDLWGSLASTFGWRDEIESTRKNGSRYWAEVSVSPMRDRAGVLIGFHAVVHDVSSRKQVELLSITDELTGLNNRRYFNQTFPRELIRARRAKDPVTFAILDVDHFKLYNDTYGHQKGDEVLHAVGKTLKAMLKRPTDFVFRIGGEEFGILLIGMTSEKAESYLNAIRLELIGLRILHEHNDNIGWVSASFGAVHVHLAEPVKDGEYFRDADVKLYEAKKNGRNRVIMTILDEALEKPDVASPEFVST